VPVWKARLHRQSALLAGAVLAKLAAQKRLYTI
jgi:hypothetical protein